MSREMLPSIGLGTWQNTDPDQCSRTVATALESGYRHVDTARYYGNEAAVGTGIDTADVSREEVFLATKVHPFKEGLDYDGVYAGARQSMELLDVDYLDLLYVHWPVGDYDASDTFAAFDDLVDDGLIRHVGVSGTSLRNSSMRHATPSTRHCSPIRSSYTRSSRSPNSSQTPRSTTTPSWRTRHSPAVRRSISLPFGPSPRNTTCSPAQACLAWVTSHENVVAIPKATGEAHLRDNLAASDLELDDEDVAAVDAVERRERFVDREGSP